MKRFFQTFVVLVMLACVGYSLGVLPSGEAGNKKLAVGDAAPAFKAIPATGGKPVSLSDYAGKKLLLVFYPMDNTPGCTIQLCSLRDELDKFKAAGIAILASNPGSLKSHEEFVKRQSYPFPILVDAQKTVAKAYGVLGPVGIQDRVVFLIDEQGTIRYRYDGIQDNDEVIAAAKAIPSSR